MKRGAFMKTIKCIIAFENESWKQISTEMDDYGKIYISEDEYIQILPLTESNFLPGAEKVIEIVFSVTSQVALGLLINWLYDKLKQRKEKKIIINQKVIEVTDKQSIIDTITDESDDE